MGTHVDHTGEIYHNRKIIGPYELRTYRTGKKCWIWSWVCLDCGKTGHLKDIRKLKDNKHYCAINKPKKVKPKPVKKVIDKSKICGKQCISCKFYRGCVCNYLLDTGHVRPKVDLEKEVCPVREVDENSVRSVIIKCM